MQLTMKKSGEELLVDLRVGWIDGAGQFSEALWLPKDNNSSYAEFLSSTFFTIQYM